MEVAQIARSISRALGLNEDLTEAVALAHDLGHTPFGHSGERALRELMADHGGFEHNEHGLRVVDLLEQQYPDFPGLNLTHEVRECIVKHQTRWDTPQVEEFGLGPAPLEGQVVEAADSIAYDNHDLQDGLEAGILAPAQLQQVALWREAEEAVGRSIGPADGSAALKQAVRYLIDRFVRDVVRTSGRAIREEQIHSADDATGLERNIIGHSDELGELKGELEEFLYDSLYMDHRVIRVTNTAQRFVEKIFEAYVSDPRQLPPEHRRRADEVGLHRAVCDYVAGMTDRFAQDTYVQLFQPYQRL
jgi:dGTPase